MASITVELPAETLAAPRRSPDQLAGDVHLAAAIYWYANGELSQERAAQAAGIDRADFLMACGCARVNVFQSDAEEFDVERD